MGLGHDNRIERCAQALADLLNAVCTFVIVGRTQLHPFELTTEALTATWPLLTAELGQLRKGLAQLGF